MWETLLVIILATLLNSMLGFIGVLTFWIKEDILNKLLVYFVAFSAGALLGGAFFHLLPESIERLSSLNAFEFAIVGFILFLLIEGFFHWHHCKKCEAHPFSYIMLVGDGIHNFIDGLVIAATFYISMPLGIVTTVMIMFHEAPQELGLFGSLIYAGHEKRKSLIYSFVVQCTSILGGIIGFFTAAQIDIISPFLISFAAGGFLYIAAADLVPEVHKAYKGNFLRSLFSISALLLGIVFMLFIKLLGG